MKVLYFHQHFSTPAGSTGIRSYAMARALIKSGHQVTMVCGSYGGGNTGLTQSFKNGKRQGNVDGIDVIEFDLAYSNKHGFIKRTVSFLRFAFRSIGVALSRDCDVIFATSTPLTAGIPGIFARWLRKKPFVFEIRDLWPELPREMGIITNPVVLKLMRLLEAWTYKSANRLIGLSPGMVDGIERVGIDRTKVAMIPNGCDIELFTTRSKPWRPDEVKVDDFMAVFSGTHGVANGLNTVLDTAAVLIKRGEASIKIVLIGQGKLKDNLRARAELEQLDNVVFLDPVDKSKLAGLLCATNVGLQVLANVPAFYYGTSPNKFFDYISAHLPVLVNYPGWNADLLENYQCGVSVPADDAESFANALIDLANNPALVSKLKANTGNLAKDFDRKVLSAEFVNWIEGAVEL